MEILTDKVIRRSANSFADIRKWKTIEAVFDIMDLYTQSHVRRVAIYAMRLARRIALPSDEIENVALGGLLHDIGKIGLSKRIFHYKNAALPANLRDEVHRHPSMGVFILKGIEFLNPIIDYVHYHHERVDGTGYPCGLKANKIPLGAKIISVVDCFDAITTDRSYQKGKSKKEAFAILKNSAGKGFCPGLVEAFIEEIEENGMVAIWQANGLKLELPATEKKLETCNIL